MEYTYNFLKRLDLTRETIDGVRIYNTPEGNFPSVTSVLGAIPNPDLDKWREAVGQEEAERISKEASSRGTRLHNAVEKYLLGEEFKGDMIVKQHLAQLIPFLKRISTIYGLEIPLYSSKLKSAGTCDCIAKIDGIDCIIDFKTSKRVKEREDIPNYFMQAAAYSYMVKELYDFQIDNVCIMLTNLEENFGNIYFEPVKPHLRDYINVRKEFDRIKATGAP